MRDFFRENFLTNQSPNDCDFVKANSIFFYERFETDTFIFFYKYVYNLIKKLFNMHLKKNFQYNKTESMQIAKTLHRNTTCLHFYDYWHNNTEKTHILHTIIINRTTKQRKHHTETNRRSKSLKITNRTSNTTRRRHDANTVYHGFSAFPPVYLRSANDFGTRKTRLRLLTTTRSVQVDGIASNDASEAQGPAVVVGRTNRSGQRVRLVMLYDSVIIISTKMLWWWCFGCYMTWLIVFRY